VLWDRRRRKTWQQKTDCMPVLGLAKYYKRGCSAYSVETGWRQHLGRRQLRQKVTYMHDQKVIDAPSCSV